MELEGSYEELYQRAAATILPHRPEEAIGQFRRLFDRLSGMSPELRAKGAGLDRIMISAGGQLASLYRWQGDYAASLQLLDQLGKLAPVLADSWDLERALTLIDSGAVEQGLDILRGLTMQHPEDRMLRLTLAQELMLHDQAAEAERGLRRVAQDKSHKDDAFRAEIMRVNLQLAHGGPTDVVAAWNRATALDAAARQLAPVVYDWLLLHGHVDGLEALLKDDGNSFRANLYLGRIAAARGDKAQAEKRWQKVLEDKPGEDWDDVLSQIEALLHLGRTEVALGFVAEALSHEVGGERAMVLFTIAVALTGEVDRAITGLSVAAGSQVRFRPRRALLDDGYWWLVQQYVTDPDLLAKMRPFFDVPQETPAAAPEAPAS